MVNESEKIKQEAVYNLISSRSHCKYHAMFGSELTSEAKLYSTVIGYWDGIQWHPRTHSSPD
jgi:hypothetical protein